MEDRYIKIDPKDFIGPPYRKCPKCGSDEFGVLSVHAESYSRRCKKCWNTETRGLPQIKKKVIYLDQFAVSDMMKSIKQDHPSSKRVPAHWRKLFERLDRLSKLQLITCPTSSTHDEESRVSEDYPSIKRILDQLSHGVSFRNYQWIEQVQLDENIRAWFRQDAKYVPRLDRKRVLSGNPDGWTDQLIVTVKSKWDNARLEAVRESRDKRSEALAPLFDKWASEKGRGFNDFLKDEILGFGAGLLEAQRRHIEKWIRVMTGTEVSTDPLALLSPGPSVIISQIKATLKDLNVPEAELERKMVTYLQDEFVGRCPFLDIESHLWASLARKAASGQKEYPNRGTGNDFQTISCLMPYCDAMLIDNACRGYINDEPLRSRFASYAKVFSPKTHKEFLDYLEAIEINADPTHLEQLRDVYGGSVGKPYVEIFELEDIDES